MKISTLIAKYGPLGLIRKDRAAALCEQGAERRILTIVEAGGKYEGCVGQRRVDVLVQYESLKPMPKTIHLSDAEVWWGSDGLPEDEDGDRRAPPHSCDENAVPYESDGPLGHGWECGVCHKFLQAG